MYWKWHVGLGRELGLAFWATVFLEATYGTYIGIWSLWIEQLGAPIVIVGLVLGASGVVRPFVLGPSSWLAERFGTRRLVIGARVLALSGLLVASAAGTWSILLITVVTNALGEVVFPFVHAYVADHAGEEKARAFALIFSVGPSLALMVSPLVAGGLIAMFGIPASLVLAATTTAGALVFLTLMRFPGAKEHDRGTLDASYRAAVRETELRRIFVTHGVTILTLALGVSLIPNFLNDVRGLEAATISTLGAGAALGSTVYGLVLARVGRLQRAPFIGAAIAVLAVATSLGLFASQASVSLIGLAFILRGGLFSAWVLFLTALGESSPAHLRSRAFTIVEIMGGSALSFGPVIAAQLYRIDPVAPIIVSAIASVLLVPYILHGHIQRTVVGRLHVPSSKPNPEATLGDEQE